MLRTREIAKSTMISGKLTTTGSSSRQTLRSSEKLSVPSKRTEASLTWPRRSRLGWPSWTLPLREGSMLRISRLRLWRRWPKTFKLSCLTLIALIDSYRESKKETTTYSRALPTKRTSP